MVSDYTMMIDVPLLKIVCPARTEAQLSKWITPLRKICLTYDVRSLRRIAVFIAQMAHEFGFVEGQVENLNYSAKRLAEVWKRYAINPEAPSKLRQPNALAKRLAGKPAAIGNNVYADRMGNGNEASGDGFRFAAVGPGLTGRTNFTLFGKSVGMTPEQAVEFTKTIDGSVQAFGWFWNKNRLNPLADTPGVEDETQKINGGQTGVADRRIKTNLLIKEMIRREKLPAYSKLIKV